MSDKLDHDIHMQIERIMKLDFFDTITYAEDIEFVTREGAELFQANILEFLKATSDMVMELSEIDNEEVNNVLEKYGVRL